MSILMKTYQHYSRQKKRLKFKCSVTINSHFWCLFSEYCAKVLKKLIGNVKNIIECDFSVESNCWCFNEYEIFGEFLILSYKNMILYSMIHLIIKTDYFTKMLRFIYRYSPCERRETKKNHTHRHNIYNNETYVQFRFGAQTN